MLLKFFQNWLGGVLEFSVFFTFLKFRKISVFWDYLENPSRYVSVPRDKKVSSHDKKTFDVVFFTPTRPLRVVFLNPPLTLKYAIF